MRFFTLEWWCGMQQGHVVDPTTSYLTHLASIRDRLPPDLLATEESASLHDTRLRELRLPPDKDLLLLGLENYEGDERLTLAYRGLERFATSADPKIGLAGPHGYGDLGYCEVDVLPHGALEHRLLFSTGIELVIIFRDFRLQKESVA
jgi:hypothetical protein